MRKTVTCIFVHGWAMNSAVWDDCIEQLPKWINVVVVDLPGHGTMAGVKANTLDDYVQSLVPLVHRPVIWVGWSLGGLAVLRLLEQYPERVGAALVVATNPCFVRQDDWSCAVDLDIFNQFAADLDKNQDKTIRRFLALQVKGLSNSASVVRQLQNSIQSRGQASSQALECGLDILKQTDFRPMLKSMNKPLHWLLGGKDSLVPLALAEELTQHYQQQNVVLNAQASHAPFISHRDDFVKQLIKIAEQWRIHI